MERFMPKKIEKISSGEGKIDTKHIPVEGYKKYWQPNQSHTKESHEGTYQESAGKTIDNSENPRFFQIPLSEEEKNMKRSELAKKLGIGLIAVDYAKTKGYYTKKNKEYVFSKNGDRFYQERRNSTTEYINSPTTTRIKSLESILGNDEEKKEIEQQVKDFKNINNVASHWLSQKDRMNKKFKLTNGQEVLIGDLTILNLFSKFNVSRDQNGKLQIFDPKTNTYKSFNMTDVTKSVKRPFLFNDVEISKDKENNIIKAYPTSMAYWKKISPNVIRQGILREEDFPIRPANSGSYELSGAHERKITNTKPQIYFSNENGSAQYYLGRNKFIGTEKKINHDKVSVLLLDNNTAGVVENIHGKKEILFTFPLISKNEYKSKREVVVNKLEAKGRDTNEKNIGAQILVGGEEMKERVKEYSITNYIKQKQNESPTQYAERISRLSDVGYTLGQFREFMAEAGVGAQNFKWEEQLVLADAFTSVENKETILDFAQKFGENGLRTFLSVEHGGRPMGNKIIEVGNNLNGNTAKEVFSKYGEIVDSAKSVGEEIQNLFINKNLPQDKIDKIKEQLLERAKNLLISCADNKKNEIGVTEELERIKKDIMITGMAFKELYKNGDSVALEDIEGMSFESSKTQDLSAKDKVEMTKIYELSRPVVTFENAKHIKILLDEFKANLEKENTFIYNVKVNDKIMAFATFYQTNPDTLHVGGLSFHPDVKNPAVGVAVMDSMLKDLGKYNIEAEVHSKNQILAMYTKRFGFKITKELPNLDGSGELYYLVERAKDTKQNQEKIAA